MIRVRKRPAIIGLFIVLLVVGGVTAWLVARSRKNNGTGDEVSYVSAVDTAKAAIKDGVSSANAEQALLIATDLMNTGKASEARASVEGISDELLTNVQIKNKYTILLDGYRLENNKTSFVATVDAYKALVAARNDEKLTQETSYLTPAYIEAVFTQQPVVPEGEEVP